MPVSTTAVASDVPSPDDHHLDPEQKEDFRDRRRRHGAPDKTDREMKTDVSKAIVAAVHYFAIGALVMSKEYLDDVALKTRRKVGGRSVGTGNLTIDDAPMADALYIERIDGGGHKGLLEACYRLENQRGGNTLPPVSQTELEAYRPALPPGEVIQILGLDQAQVAHNDAADKTKAIPSEAEENPQHHNDEEAEP